MPELPSRLSAPPLQDATHGHVLIAFFLSRNTDDAVVSLVKLACLCLMVTPLGNMTLTSICVLFLFHLHQLPIIASHLASPHLFIVLNLSLMVIVGPRFSFCMKISHSTLYNAAFLAQCAHVIPSCDPPLPVETVIAGTSLHSRPSTLVV